MTGRTFNIIYWQSFELISTISAYTFEHCNISQHIYFKFVSDTRHIFLLAIQAIYFIA